MKYSVNKTHYRDFNVTELGKRGGRAYFIPYTSKKKLSAVDFREERYNSDLVTVLSGEWGFRHYDHLADLPDEIDTDAVSFDTVKVPSTWQRTGYESPVYLNCPYEFEKFPPELPEDMTAGVYRKEFTVREDGGKVFIAFLGVNPCIDLYVNGSFVGYSEGSHNTAEFDLTPYVAKGTNELIAVLHKWCTGTYLECQDMFRENGIFRDVLLYELPETYIEDYYLRTVADAYGYSVRCEVNVNGFDKDHTVEITCAAPDGSVLFSGEAPANETVTYKDLRPVEWNAEQPYLYETFITLKKNGKEVHTVRDRIGFKRVKIRGSVFFFNGERIKFKGVNHHDTNPVTGYCMTPADLEKDVVLMKEFNVNAVRTSHYPPDPLFLALCDHYGLYVVDEADIETHGCGCDPIGKIDYISDDLDWAPRYIDRVRRMYYRDRNHASVTMWSLGNEAGGIKCQDACYDMLHEICPEIPVHYEGACRSPRLGYDVISEMYTHTDDVQKVAEGTRGKLYKQKPFFLCEYAHAMGVGPGALEEYWQKFYAHDNLMGGCIWEWADHAVYHASGKYEYTYGGDHGERKHDGNFCVDGLFYPDRTPHTGAYEMRAVYRPVRARHTRGNSFAFTNTNRFRSSDYLRVRWELLKNGVPVKDGEFIPQVPPKAQKVYSLPLPKLNEDYEYHVNFDYYDGDRLVAGEQVALNEVYTKFARKNTRDISVSEEEGCIVVSFAGGLACFSLDTGDFVSYEVNGKQLINPLPVGKYAVKPNIFRALTDNDVPYAGKKWIDAGFDAYDLRLEEIRYDFNYNEVEVNVEYTLVSGSKKLFKVDLEYTVKGNGTVKVKCSLKPAKLFVESDLPRFGMMFELPRSLDSVRYFGLGSLENLPDYKAQSRLGVYECKVADMHEPYIKPQDNGNRGETRWLRLTDSDGDGIMVCNCKGNFSFSVHNYTQQLLQTAHHREDIRDENVTVLCVDGFIRGAGTASCGQDTLEEYRISADDGLTFRFSILPVFNDNEI